MLYPLSEEFFSIQGEGEHLGRAAYFIRLSGCGVRCPWCDTKNSWDVSKAAYSADENRLATSAIESGAKIAVITGGEPCQHNLTPLLRTLKEGGMRVHLETSGVFDIAEDDGAFFDWVALSPKLFCTPKKLSFERADEIKIIISDPRELAEYARVFPFAKRATSIWVHPEWSRSTDKALLDSICAFVKDSRDIRVRAGWQLHKNYFIR